MERTHMQTTTSSRDERGSYVFIPDAEEDFEESGLTFPQYMVAGALTGMMEHACMFPIDTIKTTMQATPCFRATHPYASRPTSFVRTAFGLVRTNGPLSLYRGITAVLAGAVPSHAFYYSVYEFSKERLRNGEKGHFVTADGAAGALAVLAHDAIATPTDLIKQRMQLYGKEFGSVVQCIKRTFLREGLAKFYVAYPTTVVMNVPFNVIHFPAYESMKILINDNDGPATHLVAGGTAGAIAAAATNPLDVLRTRLQTTLPRELMGPPPETPPAEGGRASAMPTKPATARKPALQSVHVQSGNVATGRSAAAASVAESATTHMSNIALTIATAKAIVREEGFSAYFRGIQARMIYHIPSAAICWTTYEFLKNIMLN